MNKPVSAHSTISSLAFLCLLAAPSNSLGFGGPPGGPFSNGNYFPSDGTFSAVVRGVNLAGIIQFSTTAGSGPAAPSSSTSSSVEFLGLTSVQSESTTTTGGVGSTGISTIYYSGETLKGNSQGTFNPIGNTMSVNFQASAPGQGQQTIIVTEPVTTNGTSTSNGVVTVTSQTTFVETRRILYFDSLYISGAADCKTSNAFPLQKFSGNGQAAYRYLVFLGATPKPEKITFPIAISGVRLSNTAASFNTSSVQAPSVNNFNTLIQ